MQSRFMSARTWLLAAAVAVLLLAGAGVAYATGSGGDPSGQQATGSDIDKAKSVALEHVNGRVSGTEVDDEGGAYEVEVTKDDGSELDVHLDKNFNVLDAHADNEGSDADHESADNESADHEDTHHEGADHEDASGNEASEHGEGG